MVVNWQLPEWEKNKFFHYIHLWSWTYTFCCCENIINITVFIYILLSAVVVSIAGIYLIGKTLFKNRHSLHISLEYVLTTLVSFSFLNSNLSFQNSRFLFHFLRKIEIWAHSHSILVQRYSKETSCSTTSAVFLVILDSCLQWGIGLLYYHGYKL